VLPTFVHLGREPVRRRGGLGASGLERENTAQKTSKRSDRFELPSHFDSPRVYGILDWEKEVS
jgi:hypothetical protein